MTQQQRAERLAEIAAELATLTTAAERRDFPFFEHLTDLVDELEVDED